MKRAIILAVLVMIPFGVLEVRDHRVEVLDGGGFSVVVSRMTLPVLALPEARAATDVWNQITASAASSAATENSYTSELNINGYFNFSISGTWAGTVSVYRTAPGGSNWYTVESFTANCEKVGFEPEENVTYKAGFPYAGYTSGTAIIRLSRMRRAIF